MRSHRYSCDVSFLSMPSTGWRNASLTRIAGSAASWFLFSLSFCLFALSVWVVMTLGGSCASGGPYEIAVQCPENVTDFLPWSIFGGLIAVGLSGFLAQGFGMPLAPWAWSILFCGLGALFLLAFFATWDATGLVLGLIFEVMGLIPLILEFRGSPQRIFLGQRAANGVQFFECARARRSLMSPAQPNPEGAIAPGIANWAISLGVALVPAYAGYYVARLWFGI